MPSRPAHVTDAELDVLEVLWKDGTATIRQITALLYEECTTSRYGTVQKLLERLEGKGYVARDRSRATHVFTATIDRADLIGRELQSIAARLCDGSLTPLLVHLTEGARLRPEDRERIRKLIDEAP